MKEISYEFIKQVFDIMEQCPQHLFLVLTKRIRRAANFLEKCYPDGIVPSNIILGITVWNQESADRDIPILLNCWPGKTWLSIEPILSKINLTRWLEVRNQAESNIPHLPKRKLDYVVVGCESGHNRRPCKAEWLDSIAEQCKAAGVQYLVKQREIGGKVVSCGDSKDFFKK